jgi:hypothetical protein
MRSAECGINSSSAKVVLAQFRTPNSELRILNDPNAECGINSSSAKVVLPQFRTPNSELRILNPEP